MSLVPDLGTLWAETEVSAPVAGIPRLHLAGHIDNVLSIGARKRLALIAAREPADERAEDEPRFGRERKIGGDADDDADGQTQHRPKPDRGSDAHMRESMATCPRRGDTSRYC